MSENIDMFSSVAIKEIMQDMRELLSQSNLSLLLGAGCSKSAGLPLTLELTTEVLDHDQLGEPAKELLVSVAELFEGAVGASIEDYMSEIVDLLSIAERRAQRGATNVKVKLGNSEKSYTELQKALVEIKRTIGVIIGTKKVDTEIYQRFVRAIHGSLQAGKASRGVNYFLLNYDTLVEDALGLERIEFGDGFAGAATGWWEPRTFALEGNFTRVFKIHGSIDWCLLKGDSLPRRIRAGIKADSEMEHVLIYPAATKYQETQRDPFAQILNHMRRTISPSLGSEMVLAVCGYSFGDSHVDLEIENALHQSEGRLTVVAFVGTDAPTAKLKEWLENPLIRDQVRVYANKGFYHGDKKTKFEQDMPWWKFEVLARLLGGEG